MKKKILIIEDHEEVRENTAEILELAGYDVLEAPHGKTGVNLAKKSLPDLIICDVMMPELDGYGVLHMLSRDPETAGIPFVFLTAKAEKTDLRKGMNMGADDYITKPFEDLELLDAIEMRLKKSQLSKQVIGRDSESVQTFLNEVRSRNALQELSEDRESRIYREKDVLLQEGSYPQHLLYIKRGKVKSFKTNEDAKSYVTQLHKEGDFLGYTSLLKESALEESSIALEETEVLLIPKQDFFDLMFKNRDVAHQFIRLLAHEIAEKEEQLLHLAYDTVRKRVADALVLLHEKYQSQENEAFAMAISRETLASMVGTAKESVIRVLSEFKGDDLIETDQSEIRILDLIGLTRIRY